MPSARIHEAVAKEINKDYKMNELLLRIGTVSPDSWRNVETGVKDKYLSHFWDFRVKEGQANNYEKFYLKYYNYLSNPFYFGYLIHLIVDQYWKTNIDPKYVVIENGVKGYRLKDGSFHNDENWFGYYDGLKLQRKLAEIYDLGIFPLNQDELDGFYCEIDELNLSGLFGENGSLNYINTELSPIENDDESLIYDINDIINYIKETSDFVRCELLKLKQFKLDDDNKIKIAVDIDDTLLCTKELVKHYWSIFLNDNPNIDSTKEYKWGDEELARFWGEYREKLAFGDIKPNVQKILDILFANNYRVDLLSARPIDKYASLIKKIVLFFEENSLHYNYLNLGFYSKKEFLKEHNYDILIDNEVRNVDDANDVGCVGILYGPHDDNYSGYQTSDWSEIPSIIECIIKEKEIGKYEF